MCIGKKCQSVCVTQRSGEGDGQQLHNTRYIGCFKCQSSSLTLNTGHVKGFPCPQLPAIRTCVLCGSLRHTALCQRCESRGAGRRAPNALIRRINQFKLEVAFIEERYQRLEVCHKQGGGSVWLAWLWLFLGLAQPPAHAGPALGQHSVSRRAAGPLPGKQWAHRWFCLCCRARVSFPWSHF